jgi:3-oxoacyl-[acyl-carrier-protein] synthase III
MQDASLDVNVRKAATDCPARVDIAGSGAAQGARIVPSEDVDRAFGMPPGKLRGRAGIESLAYVAENENELTLGQAAASQALRGSGTEARELDWIIATSETHHNYPSLAAQLHAGLAARENCAALDVGGGCMGLLNAFAVAQSMLAGGVASAVAVISADVHSRSLTPGRVAGEFGGLFGDGASAFVLRGGSVAGAGDAPSHTGYALGEFLFGCVGQYAAAVSVSDDKDGGLTLRFDGEALSRAAITRIEKTIAAVEQRSGIARAEVAAFATHQPNPRLMALVAKQCNVPESAFPEVARKSGNLGASTCGTALHLALAESAKIPALERRPIFLASLGPGLLFGGGWVRHPIMASDPAIRVARVVTF